MVKTGMGMDAHSVYIYALQESMTCLGEAAERLGSIWGMRSRVSSVVSAAPDSVPCESHKVGRFPARFLKRRQRGFRSGFFMIPSRGAETTRIWCDDPPTSIACALKMHLPSAPLQVPVISISRSFFHFFNYQFEISLMGSGLSQRKSGRKYHIEPQSHRRQHARQSELPGKR
ncbi:hypothetical protein CIHG_04214 [Coccidioides immitis H538.4]|uniref:Uncharacterized protein n=1 Tax=Coccidioides immitis H538.4 TaxID=396776 RepID=A0A0J8RMV9_COCIT|nr:hypothetical protein CIHG_04214 [Coccidioides immitis H538.4]